VTSSGDVIDAGKLRIGINADLESQMNLSVQEQAGMTEMDEVMMLCAIGRSQIVQDYSG